MPANYFHLLRRQMLRNYRKPLILAAPKIGLKHPKAVSSIKEFLPGTTFKPIYANTFGAGKHYKKVLICSGKVYFDIMQKIEAQPLPENHKTLVLRLEELAPFPVHQIEHELLNVPHSAEVFYMQEECMNEGAFQFAKLHIDRLLKKHKFTKCPEMRYIGRSSQHSFATGSNIDHKYENDKLWKDFEKALYA
jgi:probable 2-oxoglutarate dehydrogenase E1 component DHKTD1